MKIYLVVEAIHYSGSEVMACFSSPDSARNYIQKLPQRGLRKINETFWTGHGSSIEIQEWEVNE